MSEMVDYLLELFEPLGGISARRMFSGHGIFRDGVMFALVASGELYLKVDAENRPRFDGLGLRAFTYQRKGKPVALSYCQAPAELFDDPELALEWALSSIDAALRSR